MSSDQDWDRCPYRDESRAGMDSDNIDNEDRPVQHDVIITPGGPCGSRYEVSMHDTPRGFLGTFGNWDEAKIAIETRMGSDMVWGDIWWCSDHGNLWRIRLQDGSEIKPEDEDHPWQHTTDEDLEGDDPVCGWRPTTGEDLDKSGDDLACDVEGCH